MLLLTEKIKKIMEKQKTAVEWLIEALSIPKKIDEEEFERIIQQAIRLEKQHIIQAFEDGESNPRKMYYESGENYYSETYKNNTNENI